MNMNILFGFFRLQDSLCARIIPYFEKIKFQYICTRNNVTIGKKWVITNKCPIFYTNKKGEIAIGNNFAFNSYRNTSWYCNCYFAAVGTGKIEIGDNVGVNGIMIHSKKHIKIGNNVRIGGGTRIYDTNFHSLNYLDRRNGIKDAENASMSPVIIEDDVFIGTSVIIGKGVTIGARSTIAAGSVVVKSIPADCIAGGNPCKVIKMLKNEGKKEEV